MTLIFGELPTFKMSYFFSKLWWLGHSITASTIFYHLFPGFSKNHCGQPITWGSMRIFSGDPYCPYKLASRSRSFPSYVWSGVIFFIKNQCISSPVLARSRAFVRDSSSSRPLLKVSAMETLPSFLGCLAFTCACQLLLVWLAQSSSC